MKLEKLAALAEIVSSFAIVITLAFLTLQTREMAQQTEQTNSALVSNSRATTMMADVNLLIASASLDSEFAAVGSNTTLIAAYFRIREFAWFQYQNGILDQAAWESYARPTINLFGSPVVQSWWKESSTSLDPGFVTAINSVAGRE
jgi:hypothetical protein